MIFIDNKYYQTYNRLIQKNKHLSRAAAKQLYGYVEKHHIVPKSIGGTNDASNLVYLSGRQHFVAHKLLVKFTNSQDKYKMLEAIATFNNNTKRQLVLTGRDVELIRKANSIASSIRNKGNQHWKLRKEISDEHRQFLSEKSTASRWVHLGDIHRFTTEHKYLVEQFGFVYGRNMAEDHKEKLLQASYNRKGVPISEEHRKSQCVPKKNKDSYKNKKWWHSLSLVKEARFKFTPQWEDAVEGRLPEELRPNKDKTWWHSLALNKETCLPSPPDWPDAQSGRLPRESDSFKTSG